MPSCVHAAAPTTSTWQAALSREQLRARSCSPPMKRAWASTRTSRCGASPPAARRVAASPRHSFLKTERVQRPCVSLPANRTRLDRQGGGARDYMYRAPRVFKPMHGTGLINTLFAPVSTCTERRDTLERASARNLSTALGMISSGQQSRDGRIGGRNATPFRFL